MRSITVGPSYPRGGARYARTARRKQASPAAKSSPCSCTAAWRATERDCYREEIARTALPAVSADAVPAAEPAWLAELRLRLAALEAPDASESPLTRNP